MKHSPELADFHNALWASALSGASGTALFWWWERLDQRNAYPQYRPLRDFIADVPWNSGQVQPAEVTTADDRVRAVGLRAGGRAWLWLFNHSASWSNLVIEKRVPREIENIRLDLEEWPSDSSQVQWRDTRNGSVVRVDHRSPVDGKLHLTAPAFTGDIACSISR